MQTHAHTCIRVLTFSLQAQDQQSQEVQDKVKQIEEAQLRDKAERQEVCVCMCVCECVCSRLGSMCTGLPHAEPSGLHCCMCTLHMKVGCA